MLPDLLVSYHGREAAASPATGSSDMHNAEEKELVSSALDLAKRTTAANGNASAAAAHTPEKATASK
jgi:hypothetical protein